MSRTERRRQFIKSIEAKSLKNRSFLVRIADDLTSISSSPLFLFLNALFFAGWIIINLGHFPGIAPFDPFPFGLLTMIVSLEAIILAIFILVSQNRQSYVNTIRDEVGLQVNLASEKEITKILELLSEIRKKVGITKDDSELSQMLERTDASYIERRIVGQLENASKPVVKDIKVKFPSISDLLSAQIHLRRAKEKVGSKE